MRRIYILACSLLFLFPASLSAQDLILTSEGDSLNCKITKVRNEEVYFTYRDKDEIRSSWLRLEKIQHCQFDFYEIPEVPVEKIIANEMYPRYRVALHGGCAYRTVRLHPDLPSDLADYKKKLKLGFSYGLDLSYYFFEGWGIGIGYSGYSRFQLSYIFGLLPQGKVNDGHRTETLYLGENLSRIDLSVGIRIIDRKYAVFKAAKSKIRTKK